MKRISRTFEEFKVGSGFRFRLLLHMLVYISFAGCRDLGVALD